MLDEVVISDHLAVLMEMKIESDSANNGGCGLIREFRVRFKDAFSINKQNSLVCRVPQLIRYVISSSAGSLQEWRRTIV